jgi:hypothetical protein
MKNSCDLTNTNAPLKIQQIISTYNVAEDKIRIQPN